MFYRYFLFIELDEFLVREYKLSRAASHNRIFRIHRFLAGLVAPADYALCRFTRWRALGYRCLPFENWVFAYQVVPEGVIVRDMAHGSSLKDLTTNPIPEPENHHTPIEILS